ncbi:hypothetical protein [Segetibacter aerophilus]|uniref:Uncharacterized protein n=1 Tax=Segetibacter aerophilus TaxID=670293 RepID=A0A512B9V8_9BACT|nr:hypothetical protein [Segetibacter aerophilus]GEO08748.1 hypothetical protein SAE01_12440 [Segetibacter aerophilus]
MKKLFTLFGLIICLAVNAQTPVLPYVVPTVASMKLYYGNANRMYVSGTNEDYAICSVCTADETTVYAGAGGRKWKKVLSSIPASAIALTDTSVLDLSTYLSKADSTIFSSKGYARKVGDSVQSNLTTGLATKQTTLVSGTTIKTINGTTLLGSGDVVISGGGGSADSATFATTYRVDTAKANLRTSISAGGGSSSGGNNSLALYAGLGSTVKAEPLYDLSRLTSNGALTSGTARFIAVYLPTAQTITGVRWFQNAAGVYTANNYNGIGLYSYNKTIGALTLVASSTDDGTIWQATTATWASKAFSSTYAAAAGVYFIGALWSASATTTAPDIKAAATGLFSTYTYDFTNGARISAQLASQTTLPASTTASALSAQATLHYFSLY